MWDLWSLVWMYIGQCKLSVAFKIAWIQMEGILKIFQVKLSFYRVLRTSDYLLVGWRAFSLISVYANIIAVWFYVFMYSEFYQNSYKLCLPWYRDSHQIQISVVWIHCKQTSWCLTCSIVNFPFQADIPVQSII